MQRNAAHACHLSANQVRHLWRQEQANGLADTDATHTESALCEIAEGHVLADGHRSAGARCLRHVKTGRVHLVKEGKAPCCSDPTSSKRENIEAFTQHDHHAVLLVHENDTFHAREPAR